MKLMTDYLLEVVKFERMAQEASTPELKAALEKQAADYRKLAVKRANEIGVPPPDIPEQK
jgi:hypothetical protein